jgi:hypothetical protein
MANGPPDAERKKSLVCHAMASAIHTYTNAGHFYKNLNRELSKKLPRKMGLKGAYAQLLAEGLRRWVSPVMMTKKNVWRGARLPIAQLERLERATPTGHVFMFGFTSFSEKEEVARRFMNHGRLRAGYARVLFRMETRGRPRIRRISNVKGEEEVLLHHLTCVIPLLVTRPVDEESWNVVLRDSLLDWPRRGAGQRLSVPVADLGASLETATSICADFDVSGC